MKWLILILVAVVTAVSLTDAQKVARALRFHHYFGYLRIFKMYLKRILKQFASNSDSGGFQSYTVNNLYTLLEHANFNESKQTVFYFYGLTQFMNSTEVVQIRNAYLSNGEYNFILVDLPVDYIFQVLSV